MATELTALVAALPRELMYLWGCGQGWSRVESAPWEAYRGHLGGRDLLVVLSGMGQRAAERTLEWVVRVPGLREVWSVGFAGALLDWPVGTVFSPLEVIDESGELLTLSAGTGRLLTVPGVVASAIERAEIQMRTGALAVDRETFAIVRTCQAVGVPVRSLRVISDSLRHALPPDLAEVFGGESVSLWRLLGAVVCRPWRVLDLARLARDSDSAARVLADALVNAYTEDTNSTRSQGPVVT